MENFLACVLCYFKTEALNKYINCTLLAAEVESHSGNVADLVSPKHLQMIIKTFTIQ